jgi:hypothetical protein
MDSAHGISAVWKGRRSAFNPHVRRAGIQLHRVDYRADFSWRILAGGVRNTCIADGELKGADQLAL